MPRIVVLFLAPACVAAAFIETDGRDVLDIHMQSDDVRSGRAGGFFCADEQLSTDAAAAEGGMHFESLDVGD
ncbi:MAG: hypothetical protein ABR860_15520 [Terracidiphilus sp.]